MAEGEKVRNKSYILLSAMRLEKKDPGTKEADFFLHMASRNDLKKVSVGGMLNS